MTDTYAGYVAIIGQPNVGKSTLINRLVEKKLSIVSRKVQTTRHKILGVDNFAAYQTIFLDTPGIAAHPDTLLSEYTNRVVYKLFSEIDLILWLISGTRWGEGEEIILRKLEKLVVPVILVINKIDLIKSSNYLESFIKKIERYHGFKKILSLSAKYDSNLEELKKIIRKFLPTSPWYFPPEQKTDRGLSFLVAETIREKLFRLLGGELPYSLTVIVDRLEEGKKLVKIMATIYVERRGQRVIIIGTKGEKIKQIGILSRVDLEKHLAKKVFLSLWVKVKSNWTKDPKTLAALGYDEV